MLLGTLGAILLGNHLPGKGAMAKSVSKETKLTSQGRGIYRVGKGKEAIATSQGQGINRAGYGRPLSSASHSKMDF